MSLSPVSPALGTLLLTGAAGTLGRQLRAGLRPLARQLRLSDRTALSGPLAPGEQDQPCDLTDRAGMEQLLEGVEAVVHMGGVAAESPFEQIAPANLAGVFHLYEAARLAGTRRVVLASSNHVTGAYPRGQILSPQDPPRPDGYYALSKLYGEGMASLYWERYGIESVCLRLGTAELEPADARSLSTWLSPGDLLRLVRAALLAPEVACLVSYGVSANPARWWRDEPGWARLGYEPQDSAEPWRDRLQGLDFPAGSPMARLQGGSFLDLGPFERPLAGDGPPEGSPRSEAKCPHNPRPPTDPQGDSP
jgi:uronate dehydrogenase